MIKVDSQNSDNYFGEVKAFFLVGALSLRALTAQAAPNPGADWDWQLSENIASPQSIQVFDTDPDNVSRAQIMALNAAGVYTICYVSVGTLEDYREDVKLFPSQVLGKRYEDWPDERFADIRDPHSIPALMAKRFANCAQKGFQAVEPDNMDVYQNDSGFDISREDMLRYIRMLVKAAHAVGLEIGQKNVPELTGDLVGQMDFIITESCYQDRWCNEVLPYIKAGKPVFNAEYSDTPINWANACKYAKKSGISMILKDRDLTADLQICP